VVEILLNEAGFPNSQASGRVNAIGSSTSAAEPRTGANASAMAAFAALPSLMARYLPENGMTFATACALIK
jgi:hypothetical protein